MDGKQHMTILEKPLDEAQVIAEASGKKPGSQRWTVLRVYKPGGDWSQFVAEIIGETLVKGEERRVRRCAFQTLAKALNWNAFDTRTALFGELRDKAVDWMQAQARDVSAGGTGSGLVPIRSGGVTSMESAPGDPTWVRNRFKHDAPFDGGDGTFRSALLWLYGPISDGDINGIVPMFVEDWAATPETVGKFAGGFYSAGQPITAADVFDVIDNEEEFGLPGWADVFCRAMPHFKRESFIAARNR